MAFKYLYIDDNSRENAIGIITGLEEDDVLKIDFDNPKGTWEDERRRVLSPDFKQYDGLILDLNLEEMPNEAQIHSLYKGSSLAQEIRNLSKASDIKEIPIILLSATSNLEKYFDKTNEDLFDLIISRDKLSEVFIPIRQKLVSLCEGYKLIEKCKSDFNYSDLFRHDMNSEDIRFVGEIKSVFEYPIHTVSNFIIKNLLERSGILISEEVLATRLGIDIEKSDDWEKILLELKDCQYMGVYSSGWSRWWMKSIDIWWDVNIGSDRSLRSINANEKVEILKSKYQTSRLVSLKKTDKSKSENFWTNCIGSGVPIDSIDGLLISNQDNFFPWQDRCYISINEALKPTNKEKWKKVSPSEEFKLEQLKKIFPNERPK